MLLHGYPDTSAVWEPVVAELLAADPERHVVAYDVRGAGGSDAPPDVAGYRMEHLLADLAAVLDATCAGRRAHLVGHDWGSIQGWAAAADPDVAARLAAFTSISGPPVGRAGAWVRARLRPDPVALAELADQARRSWYIAAFQVPLVAPLAWRTVVGRAWPGALARVAGAPTDDAWPSPTAGVDGAHGVDLYRANFGPWGGLDRPGRRASGDVLVPTLVLRVDDDPYLRPSLLEGVDDHPLVTVRPVRGGHWVIRRDPALVAREVDAHLARNLDGR